MARQDMSSHSLERLPQQELEELSLITFFVIQRFTKAER
ncbi:hypothetical protein HCH_05244 [Hahella chejuensis KCTC 2396]|uniref:Uncharacterized protein n=1 Tax=Hahella chejuensis (strain KCTC 2396) TaxID=349521 RepID=Q2SBQ6_HAHCH|nr:hypothetical protein HCH_05244 [Hahella chejuensis KCTC 2396]